MLLKITCISIIRTIIHYSPWGSRLSFNYEEWQVIILSILYGQIKTRLTETYQKWWNLQMGINLRTWDLQTWVELERLNYISLVSIVRADHYQCCPDISAQFGSFLLGVLLFCPAACILFFLRIFHISTIVVPSSLFVFYTSFHLCGGIFTAGTHFVVIQTDLALFTHCPRLFQSHMEVGKLEIRSRLGVRYKRGGSTGFNHSTWKWIL